MFPRKFRRDRKLLSAKNVERAFRASTISCRITTNFARLTLFFPTKRIQMDIEILLPCHCLVLFLGSCLVFLIAGCLVGIHCLPPYWKISYVAIRLRMLLSENRWPNELHSHLPSVTSPSLIRMKKRLSHVITSLRIHQHIFCQTYPMPNNSFSQPSFSAISIKIWYQIQSNLAWLSDLALQIPALYGHLVITDSSFLCPRREHLNFS